MPLTAEERARARFLRFEAHHGWPDIAVAIGRSEEDIRHSLANARTRSPNPKRGTANLSPAALDHLKGQMLPGEALWQTVNRIFGL
jgi:hypothetical protein